MAQFLEAWLISQGIELRNYVEKDHVVGAVVIALVERVESLGMISQPRIQERNVVGRDVALGGLGLELIQHAERFRPFARDRIRMAESSDHGCAVRGQESSFLELADGLRVLPFLLVTLALGFHLAAGQTLFGIVAPMIALVFLGITFFFLVADLKRPERFHYLLLKSNWTSWLVWGGYILQLYGALLVLWFGSALFGWSSIMGLIMWPTGILAAAAAGYTAFLFGQAEGRDFWQSPLLLPHLLVQAVLAGSSALGLAAVFMPHNASTLQFLGSVLLGAIIAQAIFLISELLVPHANRHSATAAHIILAGSLRDIFWGLVITVGIVLATLCVIAGLATHAEGWLALGAITSLIGLFAYEHCFVVAGQSVAIS